MNKELREAWNVLNAQHNVIEARMSEPQAQDASVMRFQVRELRLSAQRLERLLKEAP